MNRAWRALLFAWVLVPGALVAWAEPSPSDGPSVASAEAAREEESPSGAIEEPEILEAHEQVFEIPELAYLRDDDREEGQEDGEKSAFARFLDWLFGDGEAPEREREPEREVAEIGPVVEAIGLILEVVVWCVAIAVVVLLVALLVRALLRRGSRVRDEAEAMTLSRRSAPEREEELVGDPLTLARQYVESGQLAEALRILLLGAIAAIPLRRRQQRPGLTNRDYLRALERGSARRRVFLEIARAYEAVHYGARPATREQLDRCLAAFADEFVVGEWEA